MTKFGEFVEVLYTKEFLEDIKKIRNRDLQERIKKIVQKIIDNPFSGKPLKYELKGLRSLRIRPFRITYEITDAEIIMHKFEHRKEVYE